MNNPFEKDPFYLYLRDQTLALDEQVKRKEIPKLKILTHFLTHFNTITQACGLTHVSKSLFIGLHGSLMGILKSESQLGTFHDDMELLVRKLSLSIAEVSGFKEDPSRVQLLKMYIQVLIIGLIGLLYLGTRKNKQKDKEINNFKMELTVSLMFHSEYPAELFKQLASSLGLEKRAAQFTFFSLEMIAILAILFAFSKDKLNLNSQLIDTVSARLASCLDHLDHQLAETTMIAEEKFSFFTLRSFLQQSKLAIEKQEKEPLNQVFTETLTTYGLNPMNLERDVEAIKSMFSTYDEAFRAPTQQQVNTVNLIG
ncbi:MAG: hypothetical protein ACSNEK_02370 [Parachlamydiaceae bacterium]